MDDVSGLDIGFGSNGAGAAPDTMAASATGRGSTSGGGGLDKGVSVPAGGEGGPATLAQLVAATGLARPTTHRIAVALEHHRLLARDVQGRFILGPRVAELASAAGE